jgi:hypothetical protein
LATQDLFGRATALVEEIVAVPNPTLGGADLEPIEDMRDWAEAFWNNVFDAPRTPQLLPLHLTGPSFLSLFDLLLESSNVCSDRHCFLEEVPFLEQCVFKSLRELMLEDTELGIYSPLALVSKPEEETNVDLDSRNPCAAAMTAPLSLPADSTSDHEVEVCDSDGRHSCLSITNTTLLKDERA